MSQETSNNQAEHQAASAERASQIKGISKQPWFRFGVPVVIVVALIGGFFWWKTTSSRVYIENSAITGSVIELSPQNGGVLQQTYVHIGDTVEANAVVARVDNELIKTKNAGEITYVADTLGTHINPGTVVVRMIDPAQLRVEGHLQEDKGLRDVRVGQNAVFTVDAFGGRQYQGVVDEVGNTSRSGDVVFNISDKRQEQEFDVKVRFDAAAYPELKNGMSAKIWVQK